MRGLAVELLLVTCLWRWDGYLALALGISSPYLLPALRDFLPAFGEMKEGSFLGRPRQ